LIHYQQPNIGIPEGDAHPRRPKVSADFKKKHQNRGCSPGPHYQVPLGLAEFELSDYLKASVLVGFEGTGVEGVDIGDQVVEEVAVVVSVPVVKSLNESLTSVGFADTKLAYHTKVELVQGGVVVGVLGELVDKIFNQWMQVFTIAGNH